MRKVYLVHKGPRGSHWSWNKKCGLVRQRDISTLKAKEDEIRRDYNLIHFIWIKIASLAGVDVQLSS